MYRLFIKRLLDFVFALLFLPLVILVCLIFGVLIWAEDHGSVFYLANRRGKNGKIFRMFKLRSMVMNAPDIRNVDNSTYNSATDSRVTKIGRFLRKTSLDELPQLFNVVIGQMSWIGPRPVTTDKPLSQYDEKRRVRLQVRPGITGYTQAYYRNNINQEEKLALDAEYAKNLSFLLDVKIFFKTIQTVFTGKNIYNKQEEEKEKKIVSKADPKLLIIGAGRGQLGLYKAAKELGIYTIAGSLTDNNPPGLKLADEVCFMDISKPEECAEKAKALGIDGVATSCLDTGIVSVGKICQDLQLRGLSLDSAHMCNNKFLMKQAFMKHHVSTAKFQEVSTIEELDRALEELSLPVIIKATDLQGSNGIYIARDKKQAHSGFENSMSLTKQSKCIVEEYIEGNEFGTQAFVHDHEVIFVLPHGDQTFMSHTAVPVGHYVPLQADPAIIEQAKEVSKQAIHALGLNNCAVNIDLIEKDGQVYVIELTGRVGANCLPELVSIYFGINYYKMIVLEAMGGQGVLDFWKNRAKDETAGLAKMIFSENHRGILKDICYNAEKQPDYLYEINFFKKKGDEVRPFEYSVDCIGEVVVKGKTMEECRNNLERVVSDIQIDFL